MRQHGIVATHCMECGTNYFQIDSVTKYNLFVRKIINGEPSKDIISIPKSDAHLVKIHVMKISMATLKNIKCPYFQGTIVLEDTKERSTCADYTGIEDDIIRFTCKHEVAFCTYESISRIRRRLSKYDPIFTYNVRIEGVKVIG